MDGLNNSFDELDFEEAGLDEVYGKVNYPITDYREEEMHYDRD